MENNKKSHKKFWIIGAAVIIVLVFAASCISNSGKKSTQDAAKTEETASTGENASSEQSDSPVEEKDTSSGTLGSYDVSILEAEKTTDYQGKPALIVSFDFCNNSDKETMFVTALSYPAYQNGVQLSTAIIMGGSYSAEPQMKKVQPGGRLTVQAAYVLDDDSPVTVEVSPVFDMSGTKISKIFNID